MESKKKNMKKSSKDVETNLPDFDNRPCFFNIILKKGNASLSLRIPQHFVRNHLPEEIPSKAVLKGPSGDYWNITMWQKKGNIIMQHGWHQFYQDHSLGNNELLLFRYNGNMCFDVQIFDQSGVERKNVLITRKHQDSNAEIKEEEIDTIDVGETGAQVETSRQGKRKSKEETNSGSCSRKQQIPAPAGRKCNGKLCKAAEDFTSKFPHYKHCLTKSNVDHPFILHIPSSFVRANLPKTRTKFTFRTSKQKSWEVAILYSETNKIFSEGWCEFARDNKLKMGDCCVFELVNVKPHEMRVHIFSNH
ncbi:hypothetical protein REPUB_Repub01dG0178500 [Reevesia pubescens]